jgi:hypothetical protein
LLQQWQDKKIKGELVVMLGWFWCQQFEPDWN